eukprot:jgi/Ulvmu1/9631/UM054_0063.1
MKCFLCEKQAVVWCRNDEAALCQACDVSVHAIGPLAWKHKRVPLVQAGPAEDVKMPTSEQQHSESMLELDAIRDLAGSQLSNAVPDEFDLPYEALVDIFPSCLGNGPKSWEINDLTQALRGDEQPELHHRPPTLDQFLDAVPDSAGRQDKERGSVAPPNMDNGPPCCQAATGTNTAGSNSSGSREHAAHPSKQSSATTARGTAHGTTGESMLSNFHSQALSGPSVSSPERLCHSPLVPQPCSALCAVPAAYASAASLPYLRMHGSGQRQPGLVHPGALHAGLAVTLGSPGVAMQAAVPLQPPPAAAFGNVHQLHMHQLNCAGPWRVPVGSSCAGGDEAPADATAAKAAASTAALAHETGMPAAAMGALPPEAPLGLPNLQACSRYIPITLRPTALDERVAAQQQRQRQRARFAEKKRRLGSGQGVRYQSRKRYADSRPRVNGRFIRKADLAAVADSAADTMQAHVYVPMHARPFYGYTGGGQAGDTMAMNALPWQSHV